MKHLILLLTLLTLLPLTADTLYSGGKKYQGVLQSYQKNVFMFMEYEQEQPTKFDLFKVQRIKFNKPAKASYSLASRPKELVQAQIRSYRNGTFNVVVNGKKMKVRANQLAKLDVPFNLQDFIAGRDAQNEKDEDEDKDEDEVKPAKASKFVVKGKATIIHFDDGSAPSQRQGNLCERLCADSRGKVEYVKLDAPLDSPMAKRNKLESTPQFWFYNAGGKLVHKLADRFTEEEITEITEKLRKGR